jgi:hypothetical protein
MITVPWGDYAWLPDVALIKRDATVSPVDLSSSSVQVARGSAVSDTRGTRQATLMFTPGTQANLVMPNGSTQPVSKLSIRSSEFTQGPNWRAAMPAQLPPTSQYTYALDFSADEQVSAGASSVTFSQPVISYTEDFLHFPAGTTVPSGFYDQSKACVALAAERGGREDPLGHERQGRPRRRRVRDRRESEHVGWAWDHRRRAGAARAAIRAWAESVAGAD